MYQKQTLWTFLLSLNVYLTGDSLNVDLVLREMAQLVNVGVLPIFNQCVTWGYYTT